MTSLSHHATSALVIAVVLTLSGLFTTTVHAQFACSGFSYDGGAHLNNETAIVNTLDHVMLGINTTTGNYSQSTCESLQEFLNTSLGFVTAWPCVSYGPVTTGGVSFGGVNVELIKYKGFAFQPCDDVNTTADRLNDLNMNTTFLYSPLDQVVQVNDLCTSTTFAFFCQYTIFDQSESRETFWREMLLKQFSLPSGANPATATATIDSTGTRSSKRRRRSSSSPGLGVLYASDLAIVAANQSVVDTYSTLLSQHEVESVNGTSQWFLEGGTSLTVTQGNVTAGELIELSTLTLAVASLTNAIATLKANGVYGGLTSDGCALLDLSLKFDITLAVSLALCSV